MTTEEYFNFIDFTPMFEKIDSCGLKLSFIAEKIGKSSTIFASLKNHRSLPTTDVLSITAYYCRCPISELVSFSGFTLKEELKSKEFLVQNFEGSLSYQPLRDYVTQHSNEYKNIQDLYDILPKKEMNNEECLKGNVRKLMESKGLSIEVNPEHSKGKYIDSTGRMRRGGGLSSANRAKINRDEPVNFRIIYDICKILQCNIDFVMSYK